MVLPSTVGAVKVHLRAANIATSKSRVSQACMGTYKFLPLKGLGVSGSRYPLLQRWAKILLDSIFRQSFSARSRVRWRFLTRNRPSSGVSSIQWERFLPMRAFPGTSRSTVRPARFAPQRATIAPMPAESNHPVFKAPNDPNIKVWRYVDFSKYVSLLDSGALYFSRADMLGDPYEGANSHINRVMWPMVYEGKIPIPTLEGVSSYHEFERQWTLINCWHMNEHESDAMWKLYARTCDAVAIQSTYIRLHNELPAGTFVGVWSTWTTGPSGCGRTTPSTDTCGSASCLPMNANSER